MTIAQELFAVMCTRPGEGIVVISVQGQNMPMVAAEQQTIDAFKAIMQRNPQRFKDCEIVRYVRDDKQ